MQQLLAMHDQEGMIQLFAAVKCPEMDILLQQTAESYLLAYASLSELMRPWVNGSILMMLITASHNQDPNSQILS